MAQTLSEQRDLNEAEPLFEPIANANGDPAMVQLAVQLIDRQASEYDPADLEDRNETRLRAMLDAKVQGEPVHDDAQAPLTSNVIDLMVALRKSLQGTSPEPVERAAPAKKAATKKTEKAAEQQRKQPGLNLPIEGGGKSCKVAAADRVVEAAARPRRRAS